MILQRCCIAIGNSRKRRVSAEYRSRTTITSRSRSNVGSALYEREYITTRQHRYLRRNGIILHRAMDSMRCDRNSTNYEVPDDQSNLNDQLALGEVYKRPAERGTGNEYYVHYEGTDRRLDEWAQRSQIQKFLSKEINYTLQTSVHDDRRKITRVRKRTHIDMIESPNSHSSIDDERTALEKEHEQVTRVKHIERIRYGNYEIDTWYFSPYPDDYGKTHSLYICQYCMRYMKFERSYRIHLLECRRKEPPGIEIYKEKSMSVYEVLGSNDKVYCQCLCLLAKLFLDHKTLYFDVEPFLFYVLCEVDSRGAQMVGYFSKEQGNPDGNNLACICILPPFQRSGYGKFLIQLSYEISKREGLIGSPEKPLSDLGKLSYRSYWSWAVLEVLRTCSKISITDLSRRTAIHVNDIIETLHSLKLTRYWKGDHVLYVTQRFLLHCWKTGVAKKPRLLLRPRLLRWQPR
ncbi:myst histone acetyltransferase 2 [Wuchereria bancrofti]|uniref:Histone acetyltransferase n=1 Tax=Wuchereria bancrofti TaxID=6293 RepID=J9BBD2_WUCBA|nr:myst histone acetyltransferase 2 [Wuchereria bancrofti]